MNMEIVQQSLSTTAWWYSGCWTLTCDKQQWNHFFGNSYRATSVVR